MAVATLLVEVDTACTNMVQAQLGRSPASFPRQPPSASCLPPPHLFLGAGMANWTMLAAGDLIRLGGWKPEVETAKLHLGKRAGAGCGRL